MSLRDQIEAYGKWRTAALKASGDVETQQLTEQRVILETRATVAGLGDAFAAAMGKSEAATRKTGAAVREESASMAANLGTVASAADRLGKSLSVLQSTKYDAQGFALGADGQRFTAGGAGAALGQGVSPSGWMGQGIAPGVTQGNGVALGQGVTPAVYAAQVAAAAAASMAGAQSTSTPATKPAAGGGSTAGTPLVGPTRTVNINIAGLGGTTVRVASDADAVKVEAVLRQLETAMARAGG